MSESTPPDPTGPLDQPATAPGGPLSAAGCAGRRTAILVDAGYLYASVGLLVLGTTSRRAFRVAAESLIDALIARAAQRVHGELLRMYWYDAARDRVPTVEQRQIATLPHVKVRLGNLNSAGQQKGVDAQVRQDLETLARHRAVSDVVLLAGDEDMVPAVEAAQAYGVRVHVWGVEPPYGVNQAERLIWEADTVDRLDAEFWRPHLEAEPEAEAPAFVPAVQPEPAASPPATAEASAEAGHTADGRPVVPTPADVFAARRHPHPPPAAHQPSPARLGPDRAAMEEIGSRIASRWLLTRGRDNVADLLPGPVLPTVIDKELLVEAEEAISRSLRPYEDSRRALRDGFWARLHREFGLTVGSSEPAAEPAAAPEAAPTQTAAEPPPAPEPAPAPTPAPASAPAHGPTSGLGSAQEPARSEG
ncbi:MAG TPA: NYN domain-containing protein [Mycobacteriales bacterium]